MRSPWRIGAASLVWLLICGFLGSGVLSVLGLWALGSVMLVLAQSGRGEASARETPHAVDSTSMPPKTSPDDGGQICAEKAPMNALGAASADAATNRPIEGGEENLTDDKEEADARESPPAARNAGTDSLVTPSPGTLSDFGGVGKGVPMVILSAREVARSLGVSAAVVEDAMRSGVLPGNELDGKWLCNQQSLIRWLDGRWS